MAIVTIPRRNFAANSEFVSPVLTSAVEDNKAKITLDMANAQRLDPQYRIKINLEATNDSFASIVPWGSIETWGSPLADLALPPMMRVDLPPTGWQIRARVINRSPVVFRTGFVIETTVGIRKGWQ